MKHIVLAGLLGASVLLTACGGQPATTPAASSEAAETASASTDSAATTTQIPNPFTDYETIADAAVAAGFSLDAPESIGTYGFRTYQVLGAGEDDAMIQVTYAATADAPEDYYVLRKAAGTDDISGDNSDYEETSTLALGASNTEVTVKGAAGTINLATWAKDGYSYSLGAYGSAQLTEEELTSIFEQIS